MTSFIDDAGWDGMIPCIQMETLNEFIIVGSGVKISDAELTEIRSARLTDEQLKRIYELATCPLTGE